MSFANKYLLKIFLFFIFSLTVLSCGKENDLVVEGMSPIYVSPTDFSLVRTESPKEFDELGNIVNLGNFIFIVEKNKGIHVIDNVDPKNPVKKYFWSIPGCTEFTIEEDVLYADNSFHLLVIDISDYSNIKVLDYIKDIYEDKGLYQLRPPLTYNGYFVCADKKNGILIGWELKILTNPLCETN